MITLTPTPTVAERFAWIIQFMWQATGAENYRRRLTLTQPLALVMTFWVRAHEKPRPPRVVPRKFGWLHRLFPESAPQCAAAMLTLLQEPEMAAFHAAAPKQVGRVLRPYCWMLGVKPPEWLKLPRRKRVRNINAKDPSPQTSLPREEREKDGACAAAPPAPAQQGARPRDRADALLPPPLWGRAGVRGKPPDPSRPRPGGLILVGGRLTWA
jgi:hypothetical protein